MPSPFYAARRATYLSHYPFPRFRRFRRFRYVVAVPEPRSPIISGFRAPENHVIARKNGRKRKQRCGPLAPQGHYPQMRNPEAWSLGKTAATTQTTALLCRPHPFAGTSASRDRFPPEVHAEALAAVVIVNKCITACKKQIPMDRYFRVVPPLAARLILRVRNPPIAIEKAEENGNAPCLLATDQRILDPTSPAEMAISPARSRIPAIAAMPLISTSRGPSINVLVKP
jgi:hypothetical protein